MILSVESAVLCELTFDQNYCKLAVLKVGQFLINCKSCSCLHFYSTTRVILSR